MKITPFLISGLILIIWGAVLIFQMLNNTWPTYWVFLILLGAIVFLTSDYYMGKRVSKKKQFNIQIFIISITLALIILCQFLAVSF